MPFITLSSQVFETFYHTVELFILEVSNVNCFSAVDRNSHRRPHRPEVLRADPREARHSRFGEGDLLRNDQGSHVGYHGVQEHQSCNHFYPWGQQNGEPKS